jgi:hypothetical protein
VHGKNALGRGELELKVSWGQNDLRHKWSISPDGFGHENVGGFELVFNS